MIKAIVIITGVISFLHFVFPKYGLSSVKIGEVLGVSKTEGLVNAQVVSLAVNIYCLNKGNLPSNLNILYQDELSDKVKLDLDKTYNFQKGDNCEFELKIR